MLDSVLQVIGLLLGTLIFAICLYLDSTRAERKKKKAKD